MKTKTATIERAPIWGTPYHSVNLLYLGYNLWQEIDRGFIEPSGLTPSIRELARFALLPANGFTHWKFTGDWEKRTKPRGGSIKRAITS